jgi:hypothetical protein
MRVNEERRARDVGALITFAVGQDSFIYRRVLCKSLRRWALGAKNLRTMSRGGFFILRLTAYS